MDKPIFTLNNIQYKADNETLLNIKNFEFHRGACYMLSGEMGAGKSLILNIMNKKLKPFSGEILYESNNFQKISRSTYLKEIAYVTQNTKKPFFKNTYQYIYSHVKNNNQTNKVDKLVNNIITVMDIKYLANKKVRNLTTCQFRWVDLAAKIASFPKVLFIDELEQHLSMSKVKILNKILYRKCNYEGITVIASTQNREFFSSLISVNINLNHGRITSVRSSNRKRKPSKK